MFDWISRVRRTAGPQGEHQLSVAAVPPVKPPVPAQYLALYTYLEHRYASMVVLSFEQMESLLGWALPESARTRIDWWSGDVITVDRHSDSWTAAHRTATPNLAAGNVAFERHS